MRITATISRSDVARITAYVLFRNRFFWWLIALCYAFTIWGQSRSDQRPTHWLEIIYVLGYFALIWGAFYLAMIGYFVFITVFHTATRKGVLGEHDYEIRPDGFFEATAFNETLTKWPAISHAFKTSRYIVIRQSWWLFLIVPRRAFADESAFDAFYRGCQQHIGSRETGRR